MSKITQCSFWYLVIWHHHPLVTITHFSTIWNYSVTPMVVLFLKAFAGHSGSFSCCFEQLFCGEPVSTCLCRQNATWDVISGVLKTCRAKGCSLQACNLLKKTLLEIPSWKFSTSFKAPLRNLVRSSFLVALHNVML